jgi:hypothetical protein
MDFQTLPNFPILQMSKTCWNIVNKSSTDDKTKLQATAIINDSYKNVMDLTTNGVVITDAIKYVNGKMEHLNNQEKEILRDIKQDNNNYDTKEGEETTTNGVF